MTPAEIIHPTRRTAYTNGGQNDTFTLDYAAIQAGTVTGMASEVSTFDVFDVPKGKVLSHVEARVTDAFVGPSVTAQTVILRRKGSAQTNSLALFALDDNSSAPHANGEGFTEADGYTLEAVVTETGAGIAALTAGAVKFRLHYLNV